MRKVLSLAVAVLLVFSCVTTAFAAQTATPDEANKVQALTLTKLPTKLVYDFPNDVTITIDGKPIDDLDLFDFSEDEIPDLISTAVFDINVNMDGAVITAAYADGTSAEVDAKDCGIKVTNPLNGAQLVEKIQAFQEEMKKFETDDDTELTDEQMDEMFELLARYSSEMNALVCRDYTVEVSYGGQSAEFSVTLRSEETPDIPYDEYEFVSIEDSNPKTYYISRDFEVDDFEEGVQYYFLELDTSGMKVKARNTETGEIIEISGDNIQLYYAFFTDDGYPETGKYTADGYAYDEESGCYVEVEYEFYLVNDLNSSVPEPQNTDKTSSTKDEATPAQATSNGAVQTGGQLSFMLPLFIVLLSAAAVYVSYRRKETK